MSHLALLTYTKLYTALGSSVHPFLPNCLYLSKRGHFTQKGTLPGNGTPQALCPSMAAFSSGRLGWDCMPWDEGLQFSLTTAV